MPAAGCSSSEELDLILKLGISGRSLLSNETMERNERDVPHKEPNLQSIELVSTVFLQNADLFVPQSQGCMPSWVCNCHILFRSFFTQFVWLVYFFHCGLYSNTSVFWSSRYIIKLNEGLPVVLRSGTSNATVDCSVFV